MSSKIFDSYKFIPEWYIPDNRPNPFDIRSPQVDTILPGGTCYHVFELEDIDPEIIQEATINLIYYQGTEQKLAKRPGEIEVESGFYKVFVKVRLNEQETVLFNDYNLDTRCQVQFRLPNYKDESGKEIISSDVIYSKVFKIRVLPVLKDEWVNKGEK